MAAILNGNGNGNGKQGIGQGGGTRRRQRLDCMSTNRTIAKVMLINYESMWASAKKAKGAKRKTRRCTPEIVQLCGKRLWDWASSIHRLRCVCLCVCMCVVRTSMWTHTHTHVRAYMCRHYGRIVFVLISGSGECLQHSRRGTKQGVGEMRHRGVVNGWQKTASSKSNQKKTNWFCLRVCAYVWMWGFYRFIAVALLCLSFQFYFNFSTARSPEPRCACLAGWLAQWLSAAIFISNWEAINVRVRWQH